MHELGLTREIVDVVLRHAGPARVRRVRVEVGRDAAVVAASLRFCFDVCTRETAAEGAELVIDEAEGRGLVIVDMEIV